MPERTSLVSRLRVPACAAVVLLLAVVAYVLRTRFVHGQVFVGDEVRFLVTDSWIHLRLVENLVHHFPWQNTFDPYALFPGGQYVPVAPLFDWVLAAAIVVIGRGSPTPRTVEVVAAYYPVILGVLTVVPVYLIAKRLFSRPAGLIAAGLIALHPGHFLSRSLLGYTDHHVAEVLLSTTTMLLLILAIQTARREGVGYDWLTRSSWPARIRFLALPMATALLLGAYLLTWVGGFLLVATITAWVVLQILIDHFSRRSPGCTVVTALPVLLVALLIVAPFGTNIVGLQLHRVSLAGGVLLIAGLGGWCSAADRRGWPRLALPVMVVLLAAGGAGLLALGSPETMRAIASLFTRFGGDSAKQYITEAAPLLHGKDGWSLGMAWDQFTTGFFLSLLSLAVLCVRGVRRQEPTTLLLCVWSLAMLAATLAQNRFAYYYAVNVALLCSYPGAAALQAAWRWAGRRLDAPTESSDRPGVRRRRGRPKHSRRPTVADAKRSLPIVQYALFTAATVAVLGVLFGFNLPLARESAGRAFVPNEDWLAALKWMRKHTPEPLGDPDAYFDMYASPPPGEQYPYPEAAYGVMAWWDYGYWITRMARRIPNANPGQKGAAEAAEFFTAQDEATANAVLDRMGSRYVVVDDSMPLLEWAGTGSVKGKISAMARWAGKQPEDFYEVAYKRDRFGKLIPNAVFYPEYYRSMLARLYVFGGRPVEPTEAYVISFRYQTNSRGEPFKEVTSYQQFDSYAAAKAFCDTQPPESTRIVGLKPHLTCVPLTDRLEHYRLTFRSPTKRSGQPGQVISRVQIYEYTGHAGSTP